MQDQWPTLACHLSVEALASLACLTRSIVLFQTDHGRQFISQQISQLSWWAMTIGLWQLPENNHFAVSTITILLRKKNLAGVLSGAMHLEWWLSQLLNSKTSDEQLLMLSCGNLFFLEPHIFVVKRSHLANMILPAKTNSEVDGLLSWGTICHGGAGNHLLLWIWCFHCFVFKVQTGAHDWAKQCGSVLVHSAMIGTLANCTRLWSLRCITHWSHRIVKIWPQRCHGIASLALALVLL